MHKFDCNAKKSFKREPAVAVFAALPSVIWTVVDCATPPAAVPDVAAGVNMGKHPLSPDTNASESVVVAP